MSRENWAKWVLPDEVHPATSTSWCVPVPDDPFYRAAFLGALAALGSAYKWQDDPDHKAKEVAQVWRDIADNLQKCMPEPKPPIFMSEESEIEMALICDIRIHNGKLQVKNGCDCDGNSIWADVCSDGSTLGSDSTVQPSEGTRPAPGESECDSRQMSAKDTYLVPFGVENGDTITVSNNTGAWSDDGINWTCTDGTPFILGACVGSAYHVGSDPDATLFHGQLALLVAGTYFSLTDGPLVLSGLPSGQQQATVVPNFDASGSAAGNISFDICVENGSTPPTATWCYFFNFRLSDYGWTISGPANYVSGQGYVATGDGDIHLIMVPTSAMVITNARWLFTNPSPGPAVFVGMVNGLGSDYCGIHTSQTADVSLAYPCLDADTGMQVVFQADGGVFTQLNGLYLEGQGTNPFGTDNC